MATQGPSPFSSHADPRLDPARAVPDGEINYHGIRHVRVYWNIGNAAPYFWSFDFGDSSTEHYIRSFESEVPLRSNQRGARAAWPEPSGWLEGEGHVNIRDGVLRLLRAPALAITPARRIA